MQAGRFAEAVVSAYRGWYEFVKREDGWESAKWVLINDLSLLSVAPRVFASRAEVRQALQEIADSAPDQKSHDRLQQSLCYLEQKPGDIVTKEGVTRRGIPWRPIQDSVLDGMHAEFEALRSRLIGAREISEEDSRSRYDFKCGPPGVINELKGMGQGILKQLRGRFPCLAPAPFSAREVVSSSPVHNLVTCEDGVLWYIANRNETVDYNDGRREFLALHEVGGHILHFSQLLADQTLRDKRAHLLCLSIHTSDSYFIEGIAQFLTSLYVRRIAPVSLLAMDVKRSELWFAIVHRNLSDLIEGKVDVEGAAERELAYLGGDMRTLRTIYTGLSKDVFFCCNALVYHSSRETLAPALDLEGPVLERFIGRLLTGHFNPSELDGLVSSART